MQQPEDTLAKPPDATPEVLRLTRRLHRLEETLAGVESIRDSNRKLLDRLMQDLDVERLRSRELLLNVLPASIVSRLDAGETLIADRHESVAVLLSDFVGFTQIATRLSPAELVQQLNGLFSQFDAASLARGVEKIKTIGDAYMAAAGLDEGEQRPLEAAADLALDMLEIVDSTNGAWQIRIGLHAGPLVAGVIGSRKFAYDLWGDTVNVASRLESTSEPGRIHVSEAVAVALPGRFRFEPRGSVLLKGKGEVRTSFMLGRASTQRP